MDRAVHADRSRSPEPGPVDPAVDDDTPLDPSAGAAIVAAQRARVAAETDVDARLVLGVWGAAWVVGFGALYAVAGGDPLVRGSTTVAGVVFAMVLAAAIVVTTVHVVRRTAGVHGASAVQGAMYGWAWTLGMLAVFALAGALDRAGADPVVVATAMTIAPPTVVGVLYIAGAAIWRDRTQFVLGAWILVVTVAAAFVGMPHMLAVMALAGGGGMLVAALVEAVRRRRSPWTGRASRPTAIQP